MRRLRKRYGRARGGAERAYTVEIRWPGYPTVYKVVRAKTENGASKAALYASMQAASETGRGKAATVIIHADAGTMADHWNTMRGHK